MARIFWLFSAALGAKFGGFALALGLHALIHRLAVLLRKIGAADAHVDDLNAERLRLAIELIAHLRHQFLALVAHDIGERGLAEHAAQRRVEQHRELELAPASTDRLIEFQRIDDAITREGIDTQPLSGREAITSCAGDSRSRMRLSKR